MSLSSDPDRILWSKRLCKALTRNDTRTVRNPEAASASTLEKILDAEESIDSKLYFQNVEKQKLEAEAALEDTYTPSQPVCREISPEDSRWNSRKRWWQSRTKWKKHLHNAFAHRFPEFALVLNGESVLCGKTPKNMSSLTRSTARAFQDSWKAHGQKFWIRQIRWSTWKTLPFQRRVFRPITTFLQTKTVDATADQLEVAQLGSTSIYSHSHMGAVLMAGVILRNKH